MAFYIVMPKSQAEINQLVSLLHSANIPQARFDQEKLQIGVPMVVFHFPHEWYLSSEWYARLVGALDEQTIVLTVNEFGDLLNRS